MPWCTLQFTLRGLAVIVDYLLLYQCYGRLELLNYDGCWFVFYLFVILVVCVCVCVCVIEDFARFIEERFGMHKCTW